MSWASRVRYARETAAREKGPKRWLVYAIAFLAGPFS